MPRKLHRAGSASDGSNRFNGAAAGMPRKPGDPVHDGMLSDALQWSRGRNAAETRPEAHAVGSAGHASMEPRQECRGNLETLRVARWRLVLQWSRGRNAAETAPRRKRAPFRDSFNGAAAGMPRKPEMLAAMEPAVTRFNGAAAGMPRKLVHPLCRSSRLSSFNGAAAGMPRKPDAPCRPLSPILASMEPRHECRGNPLE